MSTRARLEKILADQRARRLSVSSLASPLSKRGRDLLGALAVILILAASGAAMYFAVQLTTPKTEGTATIFPSASPPTSTSTSTAPAFMATGVVMKVCTDIPNGRLHVRFVAGDGSEVRGYLTEGETVLTAIESDDEVIKGEVWRRISSPIAGWVNVRYLCKQEGEE